MPHVVLLGDSIFDNGAYTQGDPDVVTQLRPVLPKGWAATLLAVDGARTDDVPAQLSRLPDDASLEMEMREAFPGLGIEGRIGVSTGEVVTGTEERLATGDALNVAARLQQAAQPGEVLIAEATLALVAEGQRERWAHGPVAERRSPSIHGGSG